MPTKCLMNIMNEIINDFALNDPIVCMARCLIFIRDRIRAFHIVLEIWAAVGDHHYLLIPNLVRNVGDKPFLFTFAMSNHLSVSDIRLFDYVHVFLSVHVVFWGLWFDDISCLLVRCALKVWRCSISQTEDVHRASWCPYFWWRGRQILYLFSNMLSFSWKSGSRLHIELSVTLRMFELY